MKRLVVMIVFLMALVGWFIYSTVETQEPAPATSSELIANDSIESDSLRIDYKE